MNAIRRRSILAVHEEDVRAVIETMSGAGEFVLGENPPCYFHLLSRLRSSTVPVVLVARLHPFFFFYSCCPFASVVRSMSRPTDDKNEEYEKGEEEAG